VEGGDVASIRDLFDESVKFYRKGDIEGLTEMFADDAVFTVPGARFEGRDQIREYWAGLWRAFPDGGSEIGRYAETGDMFFAEMVSGGTNTGDLSLPDGTTIPPTGKVTKIPAMVFVWVRDGKIVEENVYFDSLTMMGQLGLIPG
jgi:steroid delta-isomerase-like uncharacterized protein